MTIDSLLGGGYLRLPMPLTIVVVTLRALCQEREAGGTITQQPQGRVSNLAPGNKKRGSRCFTSDSLLGGGYLRLPMPLAVGAGTLRALCQEWEAGGNITP